MEFFDKRLYTLYPPFIFSDLIYFDSDLNLKKCMFIHTLVYFFQL